MFDDQSQQTITEFQVSQANFAASQDQNVLISAREANNFQMEDLIHYMEQKVD